MFLSLKILVEDEMQTVVGMAQISAYWWAGASLLHFLIFYWRDEQNKF